MYATLLGRGSPDPRPIYCADRELAIYNLLFTIEMNSKNVSEFGLVKSFNKSAFHSLFGFIQKLS